MKKILIYNGQLFMGGIERVLISYLQKAAQEKELDITLLIKENDPEKNVFYNDIPENIKCEFIKTEKSVKLRHKISSKKKNPVYRLFYQGFIQWERIAMKGWLKNYFQKNNYDAVIDFDMSLGKYLKEIPFPKIGWCHYSLAAKTGKKRERFGERLKSYDKIVVICDEMKKELEEIYPEVSYKGIRIYNPMNIDSILKRSEDLNELSKKDKVFMEQPYMVGVSRLVKGKGREDLIDIYCDLKRKGIKERLYLLGEGAERENLQKKIEGLGLEKDVFLLGQRKNPYPWMKNAEIFLHTSYGEGLPTVFIESMICGTPVAAYDCPTGPKEILESGKYGILKDMGDKEGLSQEVYSYLTDLNIRKSYKDKLSEKIKEFSEEHIVQEFKTLLAQCRRDDDRENKI